MPDVLIAIGSDSDAEAMMPARDLLQRKDVPCSMVVLSAHRTPDKIREAAMSAARDGVKVVIAAAGGAAHLPGMFAAWAPTLPVIAVLLPSTVPESVLNMPDGVPVAVTNSAHNAAVFAMQILGVKQ